MQFRDLLSGKGVQHLERTIDPYLGASSLSMEDQNRTCAAVSSRHPGVRMAGNVYSRRDVIAGCLRTGIAKLPDLILDAMARPEDPLVIPTPPEYAEIDIGSLPIPTYFEGDGGPYITSGIFHASYGGRANLSFHRMMYLGGNRFAVRVVPRHLMALMREARADGADLGVSISIGCDIPSLIAASCSMDFGMDELGIASALHRAATSEPLHVFEPGPPGLKAPVGAEIVILGRMTDELVPEGPFVDITSTRDRSGMDGQPVLEADLVLARKEPTMHVLLPGGNEHFLLMGLPKEPAILRSVKRVVPRIHAVRLTEGGCCWLHGVVSITQQKEGDAKNAIMAAFTGHPSMKRVIVVDRDIDVFDDRQVEWAVSTRFQAHRDLMVVHGARGSTLDPSLDHDGTTSKYGMDATMPLKDNEGYLKIKGVSG